MPQGKPDPIFAKYRSVKSHVHREKKCHGFPSQEKRMWGHHEMVRMLLKEMLDENFELLNRNQLLQFLSWCSAYRPKEPFQILIAVSLRVEEKSYDKD